MKQYEMKPYSEITEESHRFCNTTKTIVVITSSNQKARSIMRYLYDIFFLQCIECYAILRDMVLHTSGISIVFKTTTDCNYLNYGNVLYYVDKSNCKTGRYEKEKVEEIKSHFREHTEKIELEDILKIVEVADMLCK